MEQTSVKLISKSCEGGLFDEKSSLKRAFFCWLRTCAKKFNLSSLANSTSHRMIKLITLLRLYMSLKWKRSALLAMLLAGISVVCSAEMISNDLIGNDVALEKLCITRAKVNPVPFLIDERYLNSAKTNDADVTFIAADGISPQLIQCKRNAGDGKYGPFSSSPESWYWHLKKPPQFSPSINTNQGASIAAKQCMDEVKSKVNEADISSINRNMLLEIPLTGPRYKVGFLVNGIKANRYDVLVGGNVLLKSNGPDLKAKPYMCLLSPMLELRAISLE